MQWNRGPNFGYSAAVEKSPANFDPQAPVGVIVFDI
jgi:hypothetical protein